MSGGGFRAPMPSISVVIPAFDAERHLTESIDSVLAQDLAPLEVVVVDDGSTDGTASVIAAFGDRVLGCRHPTNRGVAAARNTGLRAATGDLVAMHDADDRMLPHRLSTEFDRLQAGGEAVGCVLSRQTAFVDGCGDLPTWAVDGEGRPLPYPTSAILAWRSTYDRVGGYDESYTVGEDTDWLVRVRVAGLQVELLDEPQTERRIHEANLSALQGSTGRPEYLRSLRSAIAARHQP